MQKISKMGSEPIFAAGSTNDCFFGRAFLSMKSWREVQRVCVKAISQVSGVWKTGSSRLNITHFGLQFVPLERADLAFPRALRFQH